MKKQIKNPRPQIRSPSKKSYSDRPQKIYFHVINVYLVFFILKGSRAEVLFI